MLWARLSVGGAVSVVTRRIGVAELLGRTAVRDTAVDRAARFSRVGRSPERDEDAQAFDLLGDDIADAPGEREGTAPGLQISTYDLALL
jgi:hypothetical protein